MAIKLGITGGIGSGKSVVSRLLEVMGIPVYVSDVEAKRIISTDKNVQRQLSALVGEELFPAEGKWDRRALASYMFGHPERVCAVNAIVHPCVKEDFRRWAERREGNRIVGMESAILIEAGFRSEVDYVMMVYASLETRLNRAICRDNASREQVLKRISAQMEDEEKRKSVDFVIRNERDALLIPQVRDFLERLFPDVKW